MAKRFIDFYRDAVLNKGSGGGSEPTLIDKNISANGTYNASSDNADGYKKVVVSVPNSYTASDEGKVVKNGALASQSNATYTQNDTYDTTDIKQVTVNVPTGGGGAEIIIPDNSLSAYIEGEGDPMDAQSVVNWYDLFDPTAPFNCTFQGATPSTDDKVLIMGDVLSSIDYTTVVGRYAIWGVCDIYDGIAITFSGALGYSVVDEEMPMNATTITAENDTGVSVIEAYTNESGSQKLAVNIIPSGGGGGGDDYEVFEGYFTAQSGSNNIQLDHTPSGDLVGYMFSAIDGASVNVGYKVASCSAFDNGDASYPIKIAGVGRPSSTSSWAGQMGAMQAFPSVPTGMTTPTLLTAVGYDGNGGFDYVAGNSGGSSSNYRLLSGIVYSYVAIFKKTV